jgi:hypothetical protein
MASPLLFIPVTLLAGLVVVLALTHVWSNDPGRQDRARAIVLLLIRSDGSRGRSGRRRRSPGRG